MKMNNLCIDGNLREHIIYFIKNKNINHVFKTEKDIIFNDTQFFISSEEIIKTKGSPDSFETFRFEKTFIKLFGYHNKILNLTVQLYLVIIYFKFTLNIFHFKIHT
jgi:hypothetical protein